MEIPVVTPMMALYRTDQHTYQPTYTVPMHCEDGNPQASLENLKRLKESKLIAQDIWVRNQLRRVLFQFATGEQYLGLGLSDPATLATVSVAMGFGDLDLARIKMACIDLAQDPDYDDKLPAC